ncbi:MAG TPA: hypothetical protein P5228_02535 [Bacteroidales bacterium]|nr:hypothetical protein [Bacteroidales bacterium]HRZ48576.1 hypothetical protein [Bacteroidales bacterium]
MKKLILLAVFTAVFVSCNGSKTDEEATEVTPATEEVSQEAKQTLEGSENLENQADSLLNELNN